VRSNLNSVNVAVTSLAELIVTVQTPSRTKSQPVQSGDVDPVSGTAVRATTVPTLYPSTQSEAQSMPAGALVTCPLPFPSRVSVRSKAGVNVAVTFVAELIATVHTLPTATSHPLHPESVDPMAGTAVRTTLLPEAKPNEQIEPQSMPTGTLLMDPLPLPSKLTVRTTGGSGGSEGSEGA
jgi:hypothetical protein